MASRLALETHQNDAAADNKSNVLGEATQAWLNNTTTENGAEQPRQAIQIRLGNLAS